MPRLPLSIAFAIVAVLPALGDDVPFAASTRRHHGENPIAAYQALVCYQVDLSDYELAQLRDSFESAVILYSNIPVEYIVSVDKPLIALQFAVKSKDSAQLERGFADLTAA